MGLISKWAVLFAVSFQSCTSAPPTPPAEKTKTSKIDPLLGDLDSESLEDEDVEETSEDEESADESEDSTDKEGFDPEIGRLVLPEYMERIDIDRFLRDRRDLMLRHLPLEPKYDEIFRAFAAGLILDRGFARAIGTAVDEDKAKWHWIFLVGCLTLHEDISNQSRSALLDQRKALVAQHGRSLLFLAKELDRSLETTLYQDFTRRLYALASERYLYRKVEPRQTESKEP